MTGDGRAGAAALPGLCPGPRGISAKKNGLSRDEAAFRARLRVPAAPVPSGLRGAGGRPAGRRFAVYRNNVAVALREALETGFPALRSLVGADRFAALARAFAAEYPPESPCIALYGARMADFLPSVAPLAHLPYLADVARLEQALRAAYHAADAQAIAPDWLAGRDETGLAALRVAVAPAVGVVRSRWPIVSIRRFALSGGAKPEARAETALVSRPLFDAQAHVLPAGGETLLSQLRKGATLGAAVEAAGPELDLAATLPLLLSQGVFVPAIEQEG